MKKKSLYIIFFAVILLFSGCVADDETVVISVGTTPERENVTATPTPEPTATPTEVPTATPVPEEAYDYIEDLEFLDGDSTIHYSGWDFNSTGKMFTIGGETYVKGIGMYVNSSKISGTDTGTADFSWTLEHDYLRISFNIGCEQNLQYDTAEYYGTYNVVIYADDTVIWESGEQDYEYLALEETVEMPEGATTLTVELTQTQGISGTLNVVMGSFKLYYYDE